MVGDPRETNMLVVNQLPRQQLAEPEPCEDSDSSSNDGNELFLTMSKSQAAKTKFPPGCPIMMSVSSPKMPQLITQVLQGTVEKVGVLVIGGQVEGGNIYQVQVAGDDTFRRVPEKDLVIGLGAPVWFHASGTFEEGMILASQQVPSIMVAHGSADVVYSIQATTSSPFLVHHGVQPHQVFFKAKKLTLDGVKSIYKKRIKKLAAQQQQQQQQQQQPQSTLILPESAKKEEQEGADQEQGNIIQELDSMGSVQQHKDCSNSGIQQMHNQGREQEEQELEQQEMEEEQPQQEMGEQQWAQQQFEEEPQQQHDQSPLRDEQLEELFLRDPPHGLDHGGPEESSMQMMEDRPNSPRVSVVPPDSVPSDPSVVDGEENVAIREQHQEQDKEVAEELSETEVNPTLKSRRVSVMQPDAVVASDPALMQQDFSLGDDQQDQQGANETPEPVWNSPPKSRRVSIMQPDSVESNPCLTPHAENVVDGRVGGKSSSLQRVSAVQPMAEELEAVTDTEALPTSSGTDSENTSVPKVRIKLEQDCCYTASVSTPAKVHQDTMDSVNTAVSPPCPKPSRARMVSTTTTTLQEDDTQGYHPTATLAELAAMQDAEPTATLETTERTKGTSANRCPTPECAADLRAARTPDVVPSAAAPIEAEKRATTSVPPLARDDSLSPVECHNGDAGGDTVGVGGNQKNSGDGTGKQERAFAPAAGPCDSSTDDDVDNPFAPRRAPVKLKLKLKIPGKQKKQPTKKKCQFFDDKDDSPSPSPSKGKKRLRKKKRLSNSDEEAGNCIIPTASRGKKMQKKKQPSVLDYDGDNDDTSTKRPGKKLKKKHKKQMLSIMDRDDGSLNGVSVSSAGEDASFREPKPGRGRKGSSNWDGVDDDFSQDASMGASSHSSVGTLERNPSKKRTALSLAVAADPSSAKGDKPREPNKKDSGDKGKNGMGFAIPRKKPVASPPSRGLLVETTERDIGVGGTAKGLTSAEVGAIRGARVENRVPNRHFQRINVGGYHEFGRAYGLLRAHRSSQGISLDDYGGVGKEVYGHCLKWHLGARCRNDCIRSSSHRALSHDESRELEEALAPAIGVNGPIFCRPLQLSRSFSGNMGAASDNVDEAAVGDDYANSRPTKRQKLFAATQIDQSPGSVTLKLRLPRYFGANFLVNSIEGKGRRLVDKLSKLFSCGISIEGKLINRCWSKESVGESLVVLITGTSVEKLFECQMLIERILFKAVPPSLRGCLLANIGGLNDYRTKHDHGIIHTMNPFSNGEDPDDMHYVLSHKRDLLVRVARDCRERLLREYPSCRIEVTEPHEDFHMIRSHVVISSPDLADCMACRDRLQCWGSNHS
ncbi:expressed unknown protein [Seminavis robusta]|uniref:Uncharacterized protein n=1 Tax=Seminavis robusta TaxID=568900 RepID=A0A9N8E7B8_9STRA|nr:expressed unknown protein [Seminavis robusta]|eukprot:Sro573_g168950.1 n/a (1336) ;mRNA; f:12058-16144